MQFLHSARSDFPPLVSSRRHFVDELGRLDALVLRLTVRLRIGSNRHLDCQPRGNRLFRIDLSLAEPRPCRSRAFLGRQATQPEGLYVRPSGLVERPYAADGVSPPLIASVRPQLRQGCPAVRREFLGGVGSLVWTAVARIMIGVLTAKACVQTIVGASTCRSFAADDAAPCEHGARLDCTSLHLFPALALLAPVRGQSRVPLRLSGGSP